MTGLDDIAHCEAVIASEERLASQCDHAEAALVHENVAMLYRAQLASLRRTTRARAAPGAAEVRACG